MEVTPKVVELALSTSPPVMKRSRVIEGSPAIGSIYGFGEGGVGWPDGGCGYHKEIGTRQDV